VTSWLSGPRSHNFDAAAVLQLPSETWWFEQLTTVIPITQWSWADCLLIVVVPRPTQPSTPPGSVNEDQLRLERQRQVSFIPFVHKCLGMHVKLWNPSTTRAVPERLCSEVPSLGVAISSVWPLPLTLLPVGKKVDKNRKAEELYERLGRLLRTQNTQATQGRC